eukprot:CAMPEP_0168562204 /NCGR_PEP_ID=MMETSP0413-20121227/11998_1 /TAXON_ID=136452 /ORGANISM="Filamoeba nolandi, Strain NC-AS-23-1" /LENGTH=330 /DNA_ID=CAMNT_0008593615 /DNA_START=323 /DNA_END=1315 /DNA_ORIENTATION=-
MQTPSLPMLPMFPRFFGGHEDIPLNSESEVERSDEESFGNLPPLFFGLFGNDPFSVLSHIAENDERSKKDREKRMKEVVKFLPTTPYQKNNSNSPTEEANPCSICLVEFEDGDIQKELPCGHNEFHAECIDKWICQQPVCPLCKEKVGETPEQTKQLFQLHALTEKRKEQQKHRELQKKRKQGLISKEPEDDVHTNNDNNTQPSEQQPETFHSRIAKRIQQEPEMIDLVNGSAITTASAAPVPSNSKLVHFPNIADWGKSIHPRRQPAGSPLEVISLDDSDSETASNVNEPVNNNTPTIISDEADEDVIVDMTQQPKTKPSRKSSKRRRD